MDLSLLHGLPLSFRLYLIPVAVAPMKELSIVAIFREKIQDLSLSENMQKLVSEQVIKKERETRLMETLAYVYSSQVSLIQDYKDIVKVVIKSIGESLQLTCASYWRWNHENRTFICEYSYNRGKEGNPLGEEYSGELAERELDYLSVHRYLILYPAAKGDLKTTVLSRLSDSSDTSIFLDCLVRVLGKPIAIVSLKSSDSKKLWYSDEREFVCTIADFLSQLIIVRENEKIKNDAQKNNELLKTIIDLVPHRIYARDLKGNYLLVNETTARGDGKHVEDLIGKNLLDTHSVYEEALSFLEEDKAVLKSGKPLFIEQQKVTDGLYRQRINQTVKIPFLLPNTDEYGILGVSTDITDLIEARQKAEIANLAKSKFLANMSHEIHTPLNGILGMLQILEETPLSSVQYDYVADMKHSAEYLLTILNGILEFAKIEQGEIHIFETPFSVQQLTENVISEFKHRAMKKNLTLSLEINKEIPEFVIGDSSALSQVLNALIDNAIKFTETGFIKVTVRVLQVNKDKEVIILLYSILDTGAGIPEEQFVSIFDSFTQVDQSLTKESRGIGLGLTLAKSLVEKMNGKIWVESEEDMGSCFYFSVPMRIDDTHKEEQKPGNIREANLKSLSSDKRKTILIAEDDPISRKLLQLMLSHKEYQIIVSENGKEAVQIWEEQTVDCILMDLIMPVMDGLTATEIIREKEKLKNKRTLIVGLTGFANPEDIIKCASSGMDASIQKPVNKEQLFEILTNYKHWQPKE
jgi:signal transduction histidine kinase/CheY-like chemotaxis protein